MRYLVLSDIHSSMEALEACIERAEHAGFDRVLCCGDVVGYGPDPAAVLDKLEELQAVCIRGNHDRVSSGLDEPTDFNTHARQAVYWTRSQLPETYRERLAALPMGPVLVEDAQLVHGSIADEDAYLVSEDDAMGNLEIASPRITFYGHTHEAIVFAANPEGPGIWMPRYSADGVAMLSISGAKVLINPGSVGQPRDGDWRASFVIWDSGKETLEFYRTPYAIDVTQAKMRSAGLPEFLAYRLALGR
jgi:predicted phosphodiesterase